ncbi:MAG: VanZ family protein [Burkholderiales bacterium]|nr:VanZ family protein [Burkholderiales bacterium]
MNRVLCAVAAALVLYGSLYPFAWAAATAQAWSRLWFDWKLWSGPGDVLGNIALFVPWGAAAVAALRERWRAPQAWALAWLAGFALALAAQIGQVWVPQRSPSMGDVIWNMVGCSLGLPLGGLLLSLRRADAADRRRRIAAALLAGCVLLEWLPLVPSIDFALIKAQLKSVLAAQAWQVPAMATSFASYAIAGWALSVWLAGARFVLAYVVLGAALLVGKLFIVQGHLDASVLLGAVLGCAAWLSLRALAGRRAPAWLALLLVLAYTLGALAPYRLREAPAAMNWLPFAGFLKGAMIDNSRALLGELLLFGAVLHLAREAGSPLRAATGVLALWTFLIEAMQCLVQTRSGDVTTALLVLLAGAALGTGAAALVRRDERAPQPKASPSASAPPRSGRVWPRQAAATLLLAAPIVLALRLLLRLPQLPYNVVELFRGHANLAVLLLFALALLWLGAGPAWLGRRLAASERPALWLPLGAWAVSLASLALVWNSATDESVGDIAGSTNVYWFVVNKDMWGVAMRQVFLALGPREPIDFIERCVRYSALYGPLPLVLGAVVAVEHRLAQRRLDRRWLAGLLVSAGLALWLCKGIAFDWSSTDNLNELIARDGEWGWGGGGWLYALLAVLIASAWLLGRSLGRGPLRVGLALAASALALPLGWWLLNAGLNPAVEKYSSVFSGAQFLLGPDRSHLLSTELLFLRWCALQTVTVAVAAAGIWLERRGATLTAPESAPESGVTPAVFPVDRAA